MRISLSPVFDVVVGQAHLIAKAVFNINLSRFVYVSHRTTLVK
jgi:hypothetical protein